MTSRTTRQFCELFTVLPVHVQREAREAYKLFQGNPYHPGLRFRKVHSDPDIFSARVGIGYRALASVSGDSATWFWIGSHADYDRLLDNL